MIQRDGSEACQGAVFRGGSSRRLAIGLNFLPGFRSGIYNGIRLTASAGKGRWLRGPTPLFAKTPQECDTRLLLIKANQIDIDGLRQESLEFYRVDTNRHQPATHSGRIILKRGSPFRLSPPARQVSRRQESKDTLRFACCSRDFRDPVGAGREIPMGQDDSISSLLQGHGDPVSPSSIGG